jgi:parallel beta-helix repeat protein
LSAYNTIGLRIVQWGDAWGASVSDSNFSRNTDHGIDVDANNIWVHDNVIDSNGRIGVYIEILASWNEVTDNRIAGNGAGVNPVGGVYIAQSNAYGNVIARNIIAGNVPNAVKDFGTASRIGTFVGDASITATNPWSNVVY